MMLCNCGKEYKTEKGFISHQKECEYVGLDIEKVHWIGRMIAEVDKTIFHVPLGKINKFAKAHTIDFLEAKAILQNQAFEKYKKSLWDILKTWKQELLTSEYRDFIKWVWKTYKDINLLSLRNTLCNTKIIYRYNLENTSSMIKTRIDASLMYIHEHGEFSNDFEFVDMVIAGKVSMYYIIFNDWLATKWFGRLDIDLQDELHEYVELATKTVLDRLKKEEFDELQQLACTDNPVIHSMN